MRTVETLSKTALQIHEHLKEDADSRLVAVGMTLPLYNDEPPFHPPAVYPELRSPEISSGANHPYRLLRNLLSELGLDRRNFGSPLWNPFHNFIQPGMTVLIKPSVDVKPDLADGKLYAAVTHPSILRAVIDYVHVALDGTGRIVVACGTPARLVGNDPLKTLRLDSIQEYYFEKFQFEIELCDLRDSVSGNVPVGLGRESTLCNFSDPDSLYPGNEIQGMISHSQRGPCEYSISSEVLSSDVFISIPKMKVHDRTGIALGLQGLTDIVSQESKTPENAQLYDRLLTKAEKWLRNRSLSGLNLSEDFAWRIMADLARIVTFADDKGIIHDNARRNFFCVVDGIIGGENNGPLEPDPRPCGCLVIGENLLAADMVATRLMGFDIKKLRQYDLVLQGKEEFPSTDQIEIVADGEKIPGLTFFDSKDRNPMFGFRPHPSWAGRIEV
jgi:uncharacterized protein (DUF362 family)